MSIKPRLYSRPIIPLLISIIAGILFGAKYNVFQPFAWAVILLALAIVFINTVRKNSVFSSPLILFFFLGYQLIHPFIHPSISSNNVINFAGHSKWNIVGVIDTDPLVYSNRLSFILEVKRLEGADFAVKANGKIKMSVYEKNSKLSKGDKIAFSGRIKPIKNFKNPGGFDYKRYMAFKKVRASSYARGDRIKIIEKRSEKGLQWIIDVKRKSIDDIIDTLEDKDARAVLKALLIGKKNEIDRSLREAFYRSGAGHILAISGLHIGIVATVSFLFFSWLLSFSRHLLWEGSGKKAAAILSLAPVLVYGLISGMSPSAQRAVIMTAVFLFTFVAVKEYDIINTLAISAILILLIFPPSLFSISFQLSFSAVFFITYGFSTIKNIFVFNKRSCADKAGITILQKLYLFFITAAIVSFFALAGTLPLVMFYFNQVSLAGIISNMIIVPLIGFVVVPLGLIGVFVSLISVSGAQLCITAASKALQVAIKIVGFISNFPFAAFKTVSPSHIEICLYYIIILAVLNVFFVKKEKDDIFFSWKNKKVSAKQAAVCISIIAFTAIAADVIYWINKRYWNSNLNVTIFDVGHGSSALLEFPKGYCMLLDGGGFSDNKVFDVGARIIAPLLWQKKIKTIDTIVLSHPNSDHLNGLLYIADHFNVKNVWTNGESTDAKEHIRLNKIIDDKNICAPSYSQLLRKHVINGVLVEILYPVKDFEIKKKDDSWRDLNNNSLVIKVCFGTSSFLFPGDIELDAERELVAVHGSILKSSVLLAPHHGSKTSSSIVFIEKVDPEYVIISSGSNRRFNLPHKSVINRYEKRGCRILSTAEHGSVSISTDGESFYISTFTKGERNFKKRKNF